MIGRGDLGFGAVWVAKKVPDGHIHAHANQARITELIEEEKGKTMLWSEDVEQFAIDNGVLILYLHGRNINSSNPKYQLAYFKCIGFLFYE